MMQVAQVIFMETGTLDLGDRRRTFLRAIQIVDLYHAREHVALIANLVYGSGTIKSKERTEPAANNSTPQMSRP